MHPRKVQCFRMKDTNSERRLHVVLGAGQIGTLLTESLLARGEQVRQVRRGAPGPSRPLHEWRSGDLSDPRFAEEVMRGADVVYHAVNARYHEWAKLLPALNEGILAGAERTGAKLVVLDNLYMYGRPEGPMREDAPVRPCSIKGGIRATLAEGLLKAYERGRVRLCIARASDFFGPHVTLSGVFGDRFYTRVLAGKKGEALGDPDMPHSYSYGPDVANGLRLLGAAEDDVLGQVWHLPVAYTGTTRELVRRIAKALGGTEDVATLPVWLLRGLGLFVKDIAEVPEMIYQWQVPFELDDRKFCARFGVAPTSIEEAVRATSEWAKGHYAQRLAA
jgi:nucleoside-diphosphate-sugar epimerase